MRTPIILAVTLSLLSGTVSAQISAPAWTPSTTECSAAVQTLTAGALSAVDSQRVAWGVAAACGETTALATAIGRWKASTDTATLREIYSTSTADEPVVNAAVAVAADGAASAIARVLGVRLALARVFGPAPNLKDVSSTVVGNECVPGDSGHDDTDPRPLPSSVGTSARQAIAVLEGNASVPASVRSAANCFMNAWRMSNGYPVMPLGTFSSSTLQVQYICRNRFRIRNNSDGPLDVQYRVGRGALRGLAVMGPVSPSAYADTEFEVDSATATVTLYLDGAQIGSVTGTNAACPGT